MTPLSPLVRPLPTQACLEEGRLWIVVGPSSASGEALRRAAEREGGFVPSAISRSATTGMRGVLAAPAGRVGLDVETLERVGLNATVDDGWLAPPERVRVRGARNPVLELACCWVLKEAYGKALGVGLDLPLDRLAFGARGGGIHLAGASDPGDRWRFALYRRANILLATARDLGVSRPH